MAPVAATITTAQSLRRRRTEAPITVRSPISFSAALGALPLTSPSPAITHWGNRRGAPAHFDVLPAESAAAKKTLDGSVWSASCGVAPWRELSDTSVKHERRDSLGNLSVGFLRIICEIP